MLDSIGNNGAVRPCPHLGLTSDPSTSCRFPTDSHRCFRWSLPEPAEPEWQSAYCVSGKYALCPRYAEEGGSSPAGQALAEDGARSRLVHLASQLRLPLPSDRALPRRAVLASIAAVVIGLLLVFLVILPRVLGGADQAGGGLPPALPTTGATAAPAVLPTIAVPASPTPSVTASPTAQSTATLAPTPRQTATTAAPTARPAAPSATPTSRPPTSTATVTQATRTATATQSAQGTTAATPPAVGATPGATASATPQASGATPRPTASATTQATPSPGATPTPTPTRQTTMEDGQRIYVVASGDNLWQIARAFGVSAEEIAQANELASQTSLQVGQRLVIPQSARTGEG